MASEPVKYVSRKFDLMKKRVLKTIKSTICCGLIHILDKSYDIKYNIEN